MHHHGFDPSALPRDPRFPDDDFTQAAIVERHVDEHVHAAKAGLLALLGGLFLFGMLHRHRRPCC